MKPINPRQYFGPNGGSHPKLQCTAILNAGVGPELCWIRKQVTQNRYDLASVAGAVPVIPVLPYPGSALPLLTSGPFAVLAGAAVTNTGASVITGNIGATSTITGMSSAVVNGIVHTANDAATIQALIDATAAYTTLKNKIATEDLTGDDLGGKTLTPGVYSFSTSAQLTGTLTLDFQGSSNKQIVINVGSTLTTASGSVVNIVNSNSSNQVFFVVGSSATLGSSTTFRGTIIALASITLDSTAEITYGNAVALTGSVTMIDNAVGVAPLFIPAPLPLPSPALPPARTLNRCVLVEGAPQHLGEMHITVTPFGVIEEATAELPLQDIIYTAVAPGELGNAITVEYVTGGTAGHEVVTVVGNTMTVQIQSGVSTAAQIVTAIESAVGAPATAATLHTAANFALLAGASVTSTGASVVTGDVGAYSSITPGSPPWTLNGTQHVANDAATQQALADAGAAYTLLSGLPVTQVLTGQDLGGMTLTPGVYQYATSAQLTGTLTINMQNMSNQMVVVKMGGTLTTASSAVVNIINTNASNQVYFVCGTSATLGSSTAFQGSIIAHASITFNSTVSMLHGNAIGLTGSVTLIDNAIGIPAGGPDPTSFVTAVANIPAAFEIAPAPSQLLTAAPFAVLAGAAVTNTGASVIGGDIGAISAITGMTSAVVNGTVHVANDAATQQALIDAMAAYTSLNGQVATQDLSGHDLGGMVLTPGVYSFSTSAQLTGTLTLDFQGMTDQNIVFKIGSTLTTASGSVVKIVNNNLTNRVFFVVGSSATLGSSTSFEGSIIALASVTLNSTAAVVAGNVVALTGSVTMIDNVVTKAMPLVGGADAFGVLLSAEKITTHHVETFEDDGMYEWLPFFEPATKPGEANVEHA